MPLSHCLLPLQPLDTSGRASARGKAAHAGQRRALEHEAERATVDAASPDHLEPPPCARRGASTSATRHRAGPLLSLPPTASSRTRTGRPRAPMGSLTRAMPLTRPCFPFPPPSTWSTPTSAPDTTRGANMALVLPSPRPWTRSAAHLRPSSSGLPDPASSSQYDSPPS